MLLQGCEGPNTFGLYVGETNIGAADRFSNHKRGYKPSKWVQRYGVRLLTEATSHLHGMAREQAKKIEGELARALERTLSKHGVVVHGGH